jgi:glycosyltransferase involved in cell wall biosynthesis
MYNEESNIEEAVQRALTVLPRCAERFEVIVVNDGSRDRTGEIADSLAAADPRVRVVHHPKNRGYGAALRSGIESSRFRWIFYTDGDNQFDLCDLQSLLPLCADAEIVTGFRIDRRDPWNRKLNAWVFNRVVRLLFGLRLRDIDCAFKLYRAEIFEKMSLESEGASIDLEILARARKQGARILEVGVPHYPRVAGEQTGAKLSVIFRALRETIHLWFELR